MYRGPVRRDVLQVAGVDPHQRGLKDWVVFEYVNATGVVAGVDPHQRGLKACVLPVTVSV